MSRPELRPKARAGLLSSDHSKKGQRLVAILDPAQARVTLLEPWEHAILVLADGTRTINDLAGLLGSGIAGEIITERTLERCLKYFEQEELIEPLGLRSNVRVMGPAGPRTLAHLQQAYREWHKDPVRTGQILAGMPIDPPIASQPPPVPAGLSPTVALPPDPAPVGVGSTFTVGEAGPAGPGLVSVLGAAKVERRGEPSTEIGPLATDDSEERLPVADLLKAVDDDFERLTPKTPAAKIHKTLPPVKAFGGVAEIPAAQEGKGAPRPAAVEDAVLSGITKARDARSSASAVVANPEVALNPTMVGRPPEDGRGPPVPVAPPRANSTKTSPGERVGATVGPEPKGRRSPAPVKVAEIDPLLEETQQLELNTESVAARRLVSGLAVSMPQTLAADAPGEESTTSQTSAHLSRKSADVFELLRKAGLSARSDAELDLDPKVKGPRRRLHPARAEAFQKALESLTAGDLDVALQHFRTLEVEVPNSSRVKAFIDAIRAVRGETEVTAEIALDHFEGLLEDALAYGRCPRCLSMMAPDSHRCAACAFELVTARS